MAGFVQVKEETGFPMATIAFNAIAELLRKDIEDYGREIYDKVYEALDQGGLDMLSLDTLDKDEYRLCIECIERSYARCSAEKRCGELDAAYYQYVMSTLDKLFHFLKMDSRYGIHEFSIAPP